jgi:hypothetical protein
VKCLNTFHILTILQCKKYKLNLYHTLNWYSQSFISGGGLSFDGMTLLCTFTFSIGMQPSRVFFFKLPTRRNFQLHKHTHISLLTAHICKQPHSKLPDTTNCDAETNMCLLQPSHTSSLRRLIHCQLVKLFCDMKYYLLCGKMTAVNHDKSNRSW